MMTLALKGEKHVPAKSWSTAVLCRITFGSPLYSPKKMRERRSIRKDDFVPRYPDTHGGGPWDSSPHDPQGNQRDMFAGRPSKNSHLNPFTCILRPYARRMVGARITVKRENGHLEE